MLQWWYSCISWREHRNTASMISLNGEIAFQKEHHGICDYFKYDGIDLDECGKKSAKTCMGTSWVAE